jgi:hypothetical protein
LYIDTGKHSARVTIRGGTAELSKVEHADLQKVFDAQHASFRFEADVSDDNVDRRSHALPRVALNALRVLLRNTQADDLANAIGKRLDLAPVVRDDRRAMLNWLALPARDRRFIDRQLDGTTTAKYVVNHGGMGRPGALQLLAMLHIFDVFEWQAAASETRTSPRQSVLEKAQDLEAAQYFDVLGVHFSALAPDIDSAYRTRMEEYRAAGAYDELAPEACEIIRKRVEHAYKCLSDPERRSAYRRMTFPDYDWDALSHLEAQRSESLAMRGEARQARHSEQSARELKRSADRRAARKLDSTLGEVMSKAKPKKESP